MCDANCADTYADSDETVFSGQEGDADNVPTSSNYGSRHISEESSTPSPSDAGDSNVQVPIKDWLINDQCFAPYSNDGRYYSATVKDIFLEGSSTLVKVHYEGYSNDQDELMKSSEICLNLENKKCNFPRDKYSARETNTETNSDSYWQRKENFMRMKYDCSEEENEFVFLDGEVKISTPEKKKRSVECPLVFEKNIAAQHLNDTTYVSNDKSASIMTFKAFSDEDLEKPNFEAKPTSEKLPFILEDDKENDPVQVPAAINQYLREYQREGVKFMFDHVSSREGCILGDDMGLGKTVQVIAFMSAMLGKTGKKEDLMPAFLRNKKKSKQRKTEPFLVVSPSSVMFNWEDELETWGYFKVAKFHGVSKTETIEKIKRGKVEVVLTTYETFRNHIDTINDVNWSCVIFDEAHKVKEPNALVTKAAKKIKCLSRVGLTGTPMQNNMEELWCLLDWANPNCLGSMENFNNEFATPIKLGQRFDATKRELALARKKQQEFGLLRDKWILRRTKELLVSQLPCKDERVAFAPLSELQIAIYKKILEFPEASFVVRSQDLCECGSEMIRARCCYKLNKEERRKFKKSIFQYMTLLRKVSNHAALLLPFHKASKKQKMLALTICEQLFVDFPVLREVYEEGSFSKMSDARFCGKMRVLDELLEAMKKSNDKVLVFSTSVQLLNILESYAVSRGYIYSRLDGETKPESRISVVREFNNNKDVFLCLISTLAGGLGLNLTGANRVIIFDPAWNPSSDSQAQDRAYRIGQRRDVRVYRLIASGSIEENIYLRQVYKQQLSNIAIHATNERRLFNAVAGCKAMPGKLFGIQNIFTLREDGANLRDEIINRVEEIEAKVLKVQNTNQGASKNPSTQTDLIENADLILDASHASLGVDSNNLDSDNGDIDDHDEDHDSDIGDIGDYDTDIADIDDDDDCEDDPVAVSQVIQELKRDVVVCLGPKRRRPKAVENKAQWPPLVPRRSRNSSGDQIIKSSENSEDQDDFTSTLKSDSMTDGSRIKRNTTRLHRKERRKLKKKRDKTAHFGENANEEDSLTATQMVDNVLDKCGAGFTSVATKSLMKRSAAEEKMTSVAIKDVYWHGMNSQQPACYLDTASSDESDDIPCTSTHQQENKRNPERGFDATSPRKRIFERVGSDMFLIGETPSAIRRSQFSEMALDAGFESSLDFAKDVLLWSKEKVAETVLSFYKNKEPGIECVHSFANVYKSSTDAHESSTKKTAKSPTNASRRAKTARENDCRISHFKPQYVCKRRMKSLKKRTLIRKPVGTKKPNRNLTRLVFEAGGQPKHKRNDCGGPNFSDNEESGLFVSDSENGFPSSQDLFPGKKKAFQGDSSLQQHSYTNDAPELAGQSSISVHTDKIGLSTSLSDATPEPERQLAPSPSAKIESYTFIDFMLSDSREPVINSDEITRHCYKKADVRNTDTNIRDQINDGDADGGSFSILDELLNETDVQSSHQKTNLSIRAEISDENEDQSQIETSLLYELMG